MSQEHEIDVREVPRPERHPRIFAKMDAVPVGDSVVVKNDHNPVPLRGQVEQYYGEQFTWDYLEEGPEVFRLRFTRKAEGAPQAGVFGPPPGSLPVTEIERP